MRFEDLLAASTRTWRIRFTKALLVPCCNQEAARLHQRGARRRVPNRDASYFETIRLPSLSSRPISDSDDSKSAFIHIYRRLNPQKTSPQACDTCTLPPHPTQSPAPAYPARRSCRRESAGLRRL